MNEPTLLLVGFGENINFVLSKYYEYEWMNEWMNRRNDGGHLSSSLGVVELTVALHYVFDMPVDQIIWDVSHQCYPHKMLTGRRELFPGLRQSGGISNFWIL